MPAGAPAPAPAGRQERAGKHYFRRRSGKIGPHHRRPTELHSSQSGADHRPQGKKYLTGLNTEDQKAALQRLFAAEPAAIILSNRLKSLKTLDTLSDKHCVPLLASSLKDAQVLDNLQYYAARFFARKTNLHGVFLEVLGMGVLLSAIPLWARANWPWN